MKEDNPGLKYFKGDNKQRILKLEVRDWVSFGDITYSLSLLYFSIYTADQPDSRKI